MFFCTRVTLWAEKVCGWHCVFARREVSVNFGVMNLLFLDSIFAGVTLLLYGTQTLCNLNSCHLRREAAPHVLASCRQMEIHSCISRTIPLVSLLQVIERLDISHRQAQKRTQNASRVNTGTCRYVSKEDRRSNPRHGGCGGAIVSHSASEWILARRSTSERNCSVHPRGPWTFCTKTTIQQSTETVLSQMAKCFISRQGDLQPGRGLASESVWRRQSQVDNGWAQAVDALFVLGWSGPHTGLWSLQIWTRKTWQATDRIYQTRPGYLFSLGSQQHQPCHESTSCLLPADDRQIQGQMQVADGNRYGWISIQAWWHDRGVPCQILGVARWQSLRTFHA